MYTRCVFGGSLVWSGPKKLRSAGHVIRPCQHWPYKFNRNVCAILLRAHTLTLTARQKRKYVRKKNEMTFNMSKLMRETVARKHMGLLQNTTVSDFAICRLCASVLVHTARWRVILGGCLILQGLYAFVSWSLPWSTWKTSIHKEGPISVTVEWWPISPVDLCWKPVSWNGNSEWKWRRKKKTRCHRCNQLGHWSRECKKPKGFGKGKSDASSSKGDSGAAFVEHFVATVSWQGAKESFETLVQKVKARKQWKHEAVAGMGPRESSQELLLVSSPGFGILDSGCGKTIVGRETFKEFQELWRAHGIPLPQIQKEVNHFRYGNGAQETSEESVQMPVILAGRSGFIRAALVRGKAPLLISRTALMSLQATIDFAKSELRIFSDQIQIPLTSNAAGQFAIYLLGQKEKPEVTFQEVMTTQEESEKESPRCNEDFPDSDPSSVTALPVQTQEAEENNGSGEADTSPEHADVTADSDLAEPEGQKLALWSRVDEGVTFVPISGKQGPYWHQVQRRVVTDLDTGHVLFDHEIEKHKGKNQYHTLLPPEVKKNRTDFFFVPQEAIRPSECLSVHHVRQIGAQVRQACKASYVNGKRLLVAEVFSPPRFTTQAKDMGFEAWSFDLCNGFDFRKAQDREYVKQLLKDKPPDLLVVCPPCTYEGVAQFESDVHDHGRETAKTTVESYACSFCLWVVSTTVAARETGSFRTSFRV